MSLDLSANHHILFLHRCHTNFILLTAKILTTDINNKWTNRSCVYRLVCFRCVPCLNVCAARNYLVLLSVFYFCFKVLFFSSWQPLLFRPAILSELWAHEHFIAIPPAALWPGRPDHHHHHHHKCNHFITGTPAAAARAWHLSLSSSPPQPALQPQYETFRRHSKRQRWRLVIGQRGKTEHVQFELGAEASESGVAQSGNLGDDRPQWSRKRSSRTSSEGLMRAVHHLRPLSFTAVTLHPAMWFPLCKSGAKQLWGRETKATECARAILLSCL